MEPLEKIGMSSIPWKSWKIITTLCHVWRSTYATRYLASGAGRPAGEVWRVSAVGHPRGDDFQCFPVGLVNPTSDSRKPETFEELERFLESVASNFDCCWWCLHIPSFEWVVAIVAAHSPVFGWIRFPSKNLHFKGVLLVSRSLTWTLVK